MKKKTSLAILSSLILSSSVFAEETPQETTYKIKQVIEDQSIVVAETSNPSENISAGKAFIVTFPNEKQCTLVLKEQKGKLLTLSSSSCQNRQDITRNLPLEASLIEVQPSSGQPTPQTTVEEMPDSEISIWSFPRVGLSIHYSAANEAKFEDAYISTASGSGKLRADFKTKTALGIGVSLTKMKSQAWGYLANIMFETGREVDSVTLSGPGGSATSNSTGTKPKLSFLITEGAFLYRWNNFYLPFGLNINIPNLYDTKGSDVTVSGGLGIFLGAGFILNNHSTLDIFVRSVSMRLLQRDSTGYIDYDLGTMAGIGIGYKYWF